MGTIQRKCRKLQKRVSKAPQGALLFYILNTGAVFLFKMVPWALVIHFLSHHTFQPERLQVRGKRVRAEALMRKVEIKISECYNSN